VFTPGLKEPLYKVAESGGTPVAVTAVKQTSALQSHRWPSFLHDGKHFSLPPTTALRPDRWIRLTST
jgi:hypothetical protein